MNSPLHCLVSRCIAVLASVCLPVAALGSSASFGSPELLAELPLEVVSAPIRLVIAGQPAVLQILRGSEGAHSIAGAALGKWAGEGALVRAEDDGSWRKVSRVGRHGIEVLQLRDVAPGESAGYLVAWRLDKAPAGAVSPELDLVQRLVPRSALVLSDLTSSTGSPGRTIVAWLPAALGEADGLLLARAKELGLEQRRQVDRSLPGRGDERAHFFRNKKTELALTLHREGAGTAVVIHSMETIR
jgi:hypothetical protein